MYFHGDRAKNKIAVTFDDGPSEETLNVLSVLRKNDVKATFFLVGKMVRGREDIIETIKADGHELGNHTFSHKRLWFKSKKFIEDDIRKCDDELRRLGIVTNLIRFPGLKYGHNSLSVCKKLGKLPIFIELLTLNQFAYDWFRPWLKKKGFINGAIKIDMVVEKTIRNTKNGSILGFHDYLQEIGPHPESQLIIEKVIPELKKKGFEFVTVSELLNLSR